MCKFPFVIINPAIRAKIAVDVGLLCLLQEYLRLRFQQSNPVESDMITFNASVLFACHAFTLLHARCHCIIMRTHAVQRRLGRTKTINAKLLIGNGLPVLESLQQTRRVSYDQGPCL